MDPAPNPGTDATIFIQIASYRDTECQWTVKDAFEKATHPERIFIGICQQNDPELDKDCFIEPYPLPDQVRESHFPAQHSQGVCWARHEAQKLYNGEDFVLMIDSHMRFEPDWDVKIIEELALCESKKPILTCYPPGYTLPNDLAKDAKPAVTRVRQNRPGEDIRGDGIAMPNPPEKPLHGVFWSAGFLFAPGKLVEEVPYDPYMYFNQEEISLAVRAFTHGWDIFHPTQVFLYHNYVRPESKKRPLHWEDNKDWLKWQDRSLKRLYHLVGHKKTLDKDVLIELDRYGLGFHRSLDEFSEFSGVDLANWKLTPRAENAEFIVDLEKYKFIPQPTAAKPANPTEDGFLGPLAEGHYLPPFILPDQDGNSIAIEAYSGGDAIALIFLPTAFDAYVDDLAKQIAAKSEMWERAPLQKFFITLGNVSDAKKRQAELSLATPVLADENGALYEAFGYEQNHTLYPFSVLVDRNLKIHHLITERNAHNHLAGLLRLAPSVNQSLNLSAFHPALYVPMALSTSFATKLIDYFQAHCSTDSNPQSCVIDDSLLAMELDDIFSRSLLPELRKTTHFRPTHREAYRILRKDTQHNGTMAVLQDAQNTENKHRRFSLLLSLNTDYEGGAIEFLEYGKSAAPLHCCAALLHSSHLKRGEHPILSGEQYLLQGYFYDEQAEAYRKEQTGSDANVTSPADIPLFSGRLFPNLALSSD